jgi:hypothetical protein
MGPSMMEGQAQPMAPEETGEGDSMEREEQCSKCEYWEPKGKEYGICTAITPAGRKEKKSFTTAGALVTTPDFYCDYFEPKEGGEEQAQESAAGQPEPEEPQGAAAGGPPAPAMPPMGAGAPAGPAGAKMGLIQQLLARVQGGAGGGSAA